MPLLEAKPLPALLTAVVLAGLKEPLIYPAVCDLERLGPIFPSSLACASGSGDNCRTGVSASHSEASREQVRR